jgi:hypothetical protein
MFYIEMVNSFFHLCERGYHHNHVDSVIMITSTAEADDDPVTLYLGYYD